MATATDEIYVKIIADVQNATQGMIGLAEKVVAAYVSFDMLKKVLVDSAQAYMAEEQSIVRMNAALKITGQNGAQASRDMENLARQLQRTTIYSDDTARAAEGILVQLSNLNTNGVQRIMPLIADFASSMGLDLVQAAELVGKTLGGDVNALGRYGISLKDLKDPQEKFNTLLVEMKDKFGGMAQVVANTTTGELAQFKNEVDDIKESLGLMEAKMLSPLLHGINTTFKLGSIMQVDPRSITDLATVTSMIETLSGYLGTMKGPTQHITAQTLADMREQLRLLIFQQNQLHDQSDIKNKNAFNDADAAAALAAQIEQVNKQMDEYFFKLNNPSIFTPRQTSIPQAASYYAGPSAVAAEGSGTPATSDLMKLFGTYAQAATVNVNGLNLELGKTPEEVAALAVQSKTLAGQMQQVADAAVQFGVAIAKGDTAGAFEALGHQLASMLVTYALTAAASAATFQQWGIMAFWLGVAGVGVAAEIGIGAAQSSTTSGASSLPHDIPASGKNMNISVQVSARDIARSVAHVQGNW